jgi:hypothetical protein
LLISAFEGMSTFLNQPKITHTLETWHVIIRETCLFWTRHEVVFDLSLARHNKSNNTKKGIK